MGSMGFVSQLNPKRIFQYGQEYIDKKLKRFKPNKKRVRWSAKIAVSFK